MRITNNMILNKANSNINGTKIAVDKGNTQMTTQKKIQRPSEDPVVAVRGLRLQTSLSKINQYYEKNIPDATSWMEVTETALNNINEELKQFRTLCVYGATDTLTQDDRSTILEQLKSLKESVHSHGNADYAGRTVFTGYRTDKELIFDEDDGETRYNITQYLSADDFEKVRYYNKGVTVPTNLSEINDLKITYDDGMTGNTEKSTYSTERTEYYRLRLGYDNINTPVNSITIKYNGESSTLPLVYSKEDAETRDDQTRPYGYYTALDNSNIAGGEGFIKAPDRMGVAPLPDGFAQVASTVYQFNSEEQWGIWSKENMKDENPDGGKYVPDDAIIIIGDTGDIIFGNNVASKLSSDHSEISIDYDKKGFAQGELRPEYYYDCADVTDIKNRLLYAKEDVHYDINYTIAQNQQLTVNMEANEVFDQDVQQDLNDMITSVTRAMEAYDKLKKIQELKTDSAYQEEGIQAKLNEWEALAQKEFDNYSDDMSKLYSSLLGNADEYLDKTNLAITRLGCRMDQLKMTEGRMDEQQQTVMDLQSQNDDVDLSEIVIKYMASYTAYQSSLQAAGKLGQQSLLNYI